MTEPQLKRLYFPAWNRAAARHRWKMSNGRMAGVPELRWGAPATSEIYVRLWQVAELLARMESRAIIPEDLRHALNALAVQRARVYRSGKDVQLDLSERATSSRRLEDIELDLFLALCALLVDPDDLQAMRTWLCPENAERKRLEWFLGRFPEAYVSHVARATCGTNAPAGIKELRHLALTMKRRMATRATRRAEPVLDTANAPF
jgi:hypothetical protein